MASQPPDSSSVDQAFASFVRTGHSGDLARVFDETAPELLRLASHLVSDLSLAEDLVQSTFLVAIEDCHKYEPNRPVLHWLTGILTNRAHELRRKNDRRPDPARLPSNSIQEPPQQAAATEFTEAVSNAIAGIPLPYRPVLLMHLKLGHPVQEIALVLGRAPGTVRKQLSRGMELLRKALSPGLTRDRKRRPARRGKGDPGVLLSLSHASPWARGERLAGLVVGRSDRRPRHAAVAHQGGVRGF